MSAEFLITSIIVILVPGSGVLYTLALGIGRGWTAGVLGAVAGTLAILPHMAASIAGAAALLHASALAFQIVKYLGAAYLLYMAWEVLRSGGALELTEETQPRSAGRILLDGMLIGLLNPKLSLFFLAFLPQFAPADAPGATAHMLMLAGVFMALTLVVFIGYAAFASAARRHILSRPTVLRWMRRSFAGVFGFLSLRLALSER
ncbi:MAG: LysE family translocator [Rhodospirillaceae bacterium]|nr:LysE family translocator [Rhodospirillaceae bacterium]